MLNKLVKWGVQTALTYLASTVGEFTGQAFYDFYKTMKELDEYEKRQLSKK